jgi:hypothetical protein
MGAGENFPEAEGSYRPAFMFYNWALVLDLGIEMF